MLLKAKAKRLGDTLTDMKDEALVDTLAHTLREPVKRRHCDILGDVKFWAISNTSGNTLVDNWRKSSRCGCRALGQSPMLTLATVVNMHSKQWVNGLYKKVLSFIATKWVNV